MKHLDFFSRLLSMDSTSGQEREVALLLSRELPALLKGASLRMDEVGDGTLNLLLSWGEPRLVFCTHMDTVPPYIPPVFEPGRVLGRGSCDAKGQIFAMVEACERLLEQGCTDFGLLLLSGEETGSWGAKAFSKTGFQAPFLVVGEPTENKMVSASKGTLSYELVFRGEPFHSGYPQYGLSAVDLFNRFYNALKAVDWGEDPELGATTWNVGLLRSDNPQNILSGELGCRLYFRTTFTSHEAVQRWMEMAGQAGHDGSVLPDDLSGRLEVRFRGGDIPAHYVTLPGLPGGPVAFGSDAPHLTGFGHRMICGPGSIRCAHRSDEHILLSELETAVAQYVQIYHILQNHD